MRHAIAIAAAALLLSTTGRAAELSVVGAWTLNKDLTPMPDGNRRPPEGGRGGQRGPGGGGRGGFGSRGGPGGGGPSEEEMHRMQAIRDRLTEIPDRLIITRTATTVTIADGFGRTATLNTDGKKQPRLTGEGEFSSKTQFDGVRLVMLGLTGITLSYSVITTLEPVLEEGEISRLIVTLKLEDMRGGGGGHGGPPPGRGHGGPAGVERSGPPEIKRVYDAERR